MSAHIDGTTVLDTGNSTLTIRVVAFHPDGRHLLSGDNDGVRRWRLSDGQEVGRYTSTWVNAISMSKDHKWMVCGTGNGASVWDGEMREKVVEVEDGNVVWAVDVSADSAKFATGTDLGGGGGNQVSIWNIATGEQLVGPLDLGTGYVNGLRFSPDGSKIAALSTDRLIRIFDSDTGDKLVDYLSTIDSLGGATTPLAWSDNGEQLFAMCKRDRRIFSFSASTASQVNESLHLGDDSILYSLLLAPNGKFIVVCEERSIMFLEEPTLARIDSEVKEDVTMVSIALSSDSSYVATGRNDGKIVVRDLSIVLPNIYGPFHVSSHEDEVASASGDHDSHTAASHPENPEGPGLFEGEDGNDLLEREVLSSAPPLEFDYNEVPSPASSTHLRLDEVQPHTPSHATPPSLPGTHQEEILTVTNPSRRSVFKKWLRKKSDKDTPSHKPDQLSRTSGKLADSRSPSREEPSRMAPGKRRPRTVARSFGPQKKDKPLTKTVVPSGSDKGGSSGGQGSTGMKQGGTAQQATNSSQSQAGVVHVVHQQGSPSAIVSLKLPVWMLCIRQGAHEETDRSG